MDWFSWLSKTNLDPSHVYEYALTFTHNELDEHDITFFGHEFLQSMGVSIAKHRLEILKLARSNKSRTKIHPILWFMFAIRQTKKYLSKQMQALVHHNDSKSALSMPKRNHSLRWKVAMLQRNKRLRAPPAKLRNELSPPRLLSGPKMLMLTNGSPLAESHSSGSGSAQSSSWLESEANGDSGANQWNSSFSSNVIHSLDGEYWFSSTEDIKWDSLFQNLKPT